MISENWYITFGNKNIGFSIGIYWVARLTKFKYIILECSYIIAILNQSIRVNEVLKVTFELTNAVATCCLDVVNGGRHQFINEAINQYITECGRKDCFYSLLVRAPLK